MKRVDKSALVFIALGVLIIFGTRTMNVGDFSRPGPGLFPLLLGILMILFSGISFFISNRVDLPELSRAFIPRNVLYVIGILFAYRFSLPIFGYYLSTLLLLIILLKIVGRQKWLTTMVWSIFVTTTSGLLFIRWLEVPFPKGIIPF